MQSARRPLTRDASGPGFRSVEPHRFRPAAQPTTTTAAAADPPFVVRSTENPLSKSQCQRLVTVTTRIAVSSSHGQSGRVILVIVVPRRLLPFLCRSRIERLMCIYIYIYMRVRMFVTYIGLSDDPRNRSANKSRCYIG